MTWRDAAVPLAIFALLAIAPFAGFGQGHSLTLLARAMIFGMAAISLSLIVGGAGLVSLGHAAMLGVGAYTVVVLDHARITEGWMVVPIAIAASAAFAAVTGAIAIRTSGVHFIMITLAFGQMAFFATSSLALYGGDDGYTLYSRTELFGTRALEGRLFFHFTCLALLILCWALVQALLASRFGRVLRAARENETRARAVGFEPYRYRLVAYAIAGAIGGLAGVLLANGTEFVAPAYVTWQRSGDLLFMVILGGAAGPHGALMGALAFILVEEWLAHVTEHWRLIFGPLLILCVYYMRGGIAGLLRRG
ncbi:branched-chain amino acid ABC transporter permease [Roseococcus sp. SYP-B2431]|uniref:branched-chain amino acid ABC transporter permease n=1 Tax=Roseococcus sp. SYP-B2431 TaxID=2496640 RepID=UPI001039B701|nr:branched-chain amino acid ABC transporter permease [Roseococcus sp. SYP-B2431]TCH97065.1 branched-chain amino acid ABC transporter permease [Roseococcus sp. SYP-B2431]